MLTVLAIVVGAMSQPTAPSPDNREPFAVVELFTSEGCSSCPPADRVLAEFAADSSKAGVRVFPLAFHVNYWDDLGWKDPYASAEATARQRDYAATFAGAGVYTPQMIVNGREQFVGSDASLAKKTVNDALGGAPGLALAVTTVRSGDVVRVSVEAPEASGRAGLVVNAALIQRGLASQVMAGENLGRRLAHENVVRSFASPALAAAGTPTIAELHIPTGAASESLGVIVYVQNAKDRRVLGASRASVPAAVPAPSRP